MAIVKAKKRFPKRVCLCGCGESFQPVVEHQRYVRASHRVAAFQERRFERAVAAGVEKALADIAAGAAPMSAATVREPHRAEEDRGMERTALRDGHINKKEASSES